MNLLDYGLRFHHFGLAVRDPAPALKMLHGLGYVCGNQVHDPLQKVYLNWCTHGQMPAVELVSPSKEAGPLINILADTSESIYHLCYSSADIQKSVEAIRQDGVRVLPVGEPKPAMLFGSRLVAFYQIRGFGLIEIVEEV